VGIKHNPLPREPQQLLPPQPSAEHDNEQRGAFSRLDRLPQACGAKARRMEQWFSQRVPDAEGRPSTDRRDMSHGWSSPSATCWAADAS